MFRWLINHKQTITSCHTPNSPRSSLISPSLLLLCEHARIQTWLFRAKGKIVKRCWKIPNNSKKDNSCSHTAENNGYWQNAHSNFYLSMPRYRLYWTSVAQNNQSVSQDRIQKEPSQVKLMWVVQLLSIQSNGRREKNGIDISDIFIRYLFSYRELNTIFYSQHIWNSVHFQNF